ncbi:hypothetical protein NQ317_001881 [Molorchus minor]|uniref:Uncharacterized protein n=1 Tax=Molorchus minor TaxID=1323400 RepID=A0ABQ9J670_9CUCU|nr:hypothetical protein NQ317_001881 [Molorchus minor]
MCEFQTKLKGCLKSHLLGHKDISDVQIFKCKMCEYQTRYRGSLRYHLLPTRIFPKYKYLNVKCTRHRRSLKTHLLGHTGVQKCEMCEYQTKHKKLILKKHLLMSQGYFRSAKAKQKQLLKQHLLVHKNFSEVQMFKCELCEHQTKRREPSKLTCSFIKIFQRCKRLSVKFVNFRRNIRGA